MIAGAIAGVIIATLLIKNHKLKVEMNILQRQLSYLKSSSDYDGTFKIQSDNE